jgi:hypothetical protein
MSDAPTIYVALAAVMKSVRAVGKDGWNDHQKFKFRGIDGVVNAVGPALREHGVIVVPEVLSVAYDSVQTSTGKTNTACRVQVAYTFWGPDGTSITACVPGESWDAGDKSCPKAMSVAFRTALLQALALPTDEPDPDEHTYERAAEHTTKTEPSPEVAPLLERIRVLASETGIAPTDVLERFAAQHDGLHITRATVDQLSPVLGELTARKARMDQDAAAEGTANA